MLELQFMVKATELSKVRERLIKKMEKEKLHPDVAKNQVAVDVLNGVIEELNSEFEIEDYE